MFYLLFLQCFLHKDYNNQVNKYPHLPKSIPTACGNALRIFMAPRDAEYAIFSMLYNGNTTGKFPFKESNLVLFD